MNNYKETAVEARKKVLELIYAAQTSHLGSNFSCIDLCTVLFDNIDIKKDEVVLSAGWKAAAWYFFLWKKGIISEEELNSLCCPNSPFIGLVEPQSRWGLRIAGGSMGLGFPGAVGMAKAKKLRKEEGKMYVVMSDGEMQCGTTWESALLAVHHQLNNFCIIVDVNGFCAMGKTEEVLNTEPLREKWLSFDWSVMEVDGHNFTEIAFALKQESEKPLVVLAQTIKGKGWPRAEHSNLFHYKAPSKEEYQEALLCLK